MPQCTSTKRISHFCKSPTSVRTVYTRKKKEKKGGRENTCIYMRLRAIQVCKTMYVRKRVVCIRENAPISAKVSRFGGHYRPKSPIFPQKHPVYRPESPIFPKNQSCIMAHVCMIRKRARYFCKRAMYFRKTAPHICQRALYFRKRAVYVRKRAL